MITFDFTQSYVGLTAFLFVVCGCLILWTDSRMYGGKGLVREKKWAKILGWSNIVLGFMLITSSYVYLKWIW